MSDLKAVETVVMPGFVGNIAERVQWYSWVGVR